MENKVYCKDCKHHKVISYGWGPQMIINHVCKINVSSTYLTSHCKDCCDINENNDCKQYKKSWWRFWIKEKKS